MNKILTFLLLVLGTQLYAQKYEMVVEEEDYKIEKTELVCNSNQGYEYVYVILKFTNLTSEDITLDFVYETWYSGECSNCEYTDHGTGRTVTIPANSSIEGDCKPTYKDYLRTISYSLTDHPNAFKDQLTDLVIAKVQKQ